MDHDEIDRRREFQVTHEVFNQSPPLAGANAWRADPLLAQYGENWPERIRRDMEQVGRYVRSGEAQELARLANSETPKLRTHDQQGNRIDLVEYHPAYHALMRRSVAMGLHSSIWEDAPDEAGYRHQIRAVRFYMAAQLECGHLCPISMTNASLAALMSSPQLFRDLAPRVTQRKYDQSQKPMAQKASLTFGLGITEKQGGTDMHANSSQAVSENSHFHRLSGHKWFMSAPMSDAFLMLAQARGGLSCFLVPRLREDGSHNGLNLQRLKDKIGNRSNASGEVEFNGAVAQMVGEPGKGAATIMDMVTLTRLDAALASAGLMRGALAEAVHHTRHRKVHGSGLYDQPLMQRVLADMALDVAAASALSIRLARSFDEAARDPAEAAFARAMTAVVKYWVCKIAPPLTFEAMECLGGNGYVEEGLLARAYREAPANVLWEGSGNVMALDVLRVAGRAPQLFDEVLAGIGRDLGAAGKGVLGVLRAAMQVAVSDEGSARILTEQLALSAAAAELRRLGAGRIADAFVETRLAGQWRSSYGMLDARHDSQAILETLYPAMD